MLLQIGIQEEGVHGQQAVQGVGGVCRNIREAAPDLFANGVLRRASISSSISFPRRIFGRPGESGDVAVFIVSPIPAMVRLDFRCRRTRSAILLISRSRSRFFQHDG